MPVNPLRQGSKAHKLVVRLCNSFQEEQKIRTANGRLNHLETEEDAKAQYVHY